MEKHDATIAVVDDDADVLASVHMHLGRFFKEVNTFSTPAEFMTYLQSNAADALLLDMNYRKGEYDGKEGLQFLYDLKEHHPLLEVVTMTAYGEVELAVEAVKAGAFDFIVKPWQNEKLLITMMNAVKKRKNAEELHRLQQRELAINKSYGDSAVFIGSGDAMLKIKELIMQVATTNANVLIHGESGTGKTLAARQIHWHSKRSAQAFVTASLTSLTHEMQEQQLLGTLSGEVGKWELATNGTLLLQELSKLSPLVQSKILSELQLLPGSETQPPSHRIISTTSTPITDAVNNGQFRQDLFYRLNTVEINLPPLRDRLEDLPELLNHFLELYSERHQKKVLNYSPSCIRQLSDYEWPGNIRELQYSIERAVVISKSDELDANDVIPNRNAPAESSDVFSIAELEKRHITTVLHKNKGNISVSASQLGLTRAALYRRIEKYKINVQ